MGACAYGALSLPECNPASVALVVLTVLTTLASVFFSKTREKLTRVVVGAGRV